MKKNDFMAGVKAGLPIGLGYLSVSFTFGIMAIVYGLKWWQAVLISMTTLTSAGQFAGLGIMVSPGHYVEMLVSQLTINVRYSFMSISLSQKVDSKFKGIFRWLLGFLMTDEIFAVASAKGEVSRSFFLGLGVLPYVGWTLGTLLGALLGNILPAFVMSALSLAIYGMFVAIVVPQMVEKRPVVFVVLIAAGLSCLFYYVKPFNQISTGFAISICAVIAAAVGAICFPIAMDDAKEEEVGLHE